MKKDLSFIMNATGSAIPAAVIQLRHRGRIIYHEADGWLDMEVRQQPAQLDTLFDLASLTKLFTTTRFLQLVAGGLVELDMPVSAVLPEFVGDRAIRPYEDPLNPGQTVTISPHMGTVDAGRVTFRHLLLHTSGLPAWRPLFQQPQERIPPFVQHTFFSYPTGRRVVYSDLGFILLGWAIENLTGKGLHQAMEELIGRLTPALIQPGPVDPELAAPTEACSWRKKRMRGEVHDENAWSMAPDLPGHAGLFGTAAAIADLGQAWLEALQGQGDLLPLSLAWEAVSPQAEDGDIRRGLGWALWSPSPESPSHPLSRGAFGHTGFTGTSLYVDPARDLVIACLTNEVYNGREDRHIGSFRVALHQAVVDNL